MNRATLRNGAVGLTAVLLVLAFAGGLFDRQQPAQAADGETAQLIGFFNSYRASQGLQPLATSSQMNADAQQDANADVNACGFVHLYHNLGYTHSRWGTYAYPTAEDVWNAYLNDPYILGVIAKPTYNAAGVGRAYGCAWGTLWIIIVGKGSGTVVTPPPGPTNSPAPSGSGDPTNPPTAAPTPSGTINHPTATPTGGASTPTGTAGSATPTLVPTPNSTVTASETPTATPEPTATPAAPLWGDGDCDGLISSGDGILLLLLITGSEAIGECLPEDGFDCVGGVDLLDVFALLEYLSGIASDGGGDCPDIGDPVPTPTPGPSETPGATATPTPTAEPTVTPVPSDTDVNHCFLAMLAHQLATQSLSGAETCTPVQGGLYTCTFEGQTVPCVPASDGLEAYNCTFDGSYVGCLGDANAAHYECSNVGGVVGCSSAAVGSARFECATSSETVACASLVEPYPDFVCSRLESGFSCEAALALSARLR